MSTTQPTPDVSAQPAAGVDDAEELARAEYAEENGDDENEDDEDDDEDDQDGLTSYTVFGVYDDSGLTVAAVLVGTHFCADTNGNDRRYCTHVQATDPGDAEARAHAIYDQESGWAGTAGEVTAPAATS